MRSRRSCPRARRNSPEALWNSGTTRSTKSDGQKKSDDASKDVPMPRRSRRATMTEKMMEKMVGRADSNRRHQDFPPPVRRVRRVRHSVEPIRRICTILWSRSGGLPGGELSGSHRVARPSESVARSRIETCRQMNSGRKQRKSASNRRSRLQSDHAGHSRTPLLAKGSCEAPSTGEAGMIGRACPSRETRTAP